MRKLIAALCLAVAAVAVSHAQAPFADVPKDHWAYEAVNTLAQRGIVIGYPDGTFGGKREMTRYEFAVAVSRMLPQVEQYVKDQVAAASPKAAPAPDLSNLASKDDLKGLLTKEDFDTISKLVDQFAPELKMLQVDVAGIRRDIQSLTTRVSAIESELDRVKISGEMNAIGRGSSIQSGSLSRKVYPTDIDGRNLNRTDNLLDPAQVYFDTDLNLKLRVNKGVYANTTLSIGNYIGGFASAPRATFPYGQAGNGSNNAEITPWKAYISAPVKAPILGDVQIEAGKTGIKFTPYTLRLQDYDSYTNITKTDNGEYVISGLKGRFNLGGFHLTAYAGTHGADDTASGMPLFITANFTPRPQNPLNETSLALFPGLPSAVVELRQSAGLHATTSLFGKNNIGLTYITAGTNDSTYYDGTSVVPVTRAEIYGANAKLKLFKGIGFSGEFASSVLTDASGSAQGGSVWPTDKHNAYDGRFTKEFGSLELMAGYRQIDPFFGAPGDWGHIGSWKNPTNIKGFVSTAELEVSSKLTLTGGFDDYASVVRGVNTQAPSVTALGSSALGNALDSSDDTKFQHITAGLKYDVTGATSLNLGLEQVRYTDIANPAAQSANGDPKESYYNFGIGSDLGDNTTLRLLYQIIDYKNSFLTNGENARGNVAVAQFQVKF
jgi:hypothetical protein